MELPMQTPQVDLCSKLFSQITKQSQQEIISKLWTSLPYMKFLIIGPY
jgi:hypothetical protein